ncbi:MAG: flagellar protein [Tissierellia bacterium]|nr:flagellar protein [Tissierellia bacterium]
MNKINIKQLENRLINSQYPYKKENKAAVKDFGQILDNIKRVNEDIVFSKHALVRMDNRNIELSSIELEKLKTAINKAEDKGVKDALILIGDKAFIASVKNKTIITTFNKEQIKENVFTNIDGAVIV